MSSDLDKGGEGTEAVGQKRGSLAASVNDRFDAVDAALVEQRQYTEFASDKLSSEMRAALSGVDDRLGGIDGRLDGVDGRLDRIDGRVGGIDRRLSSIDTRLERFDGRFNTLERKLDQFIDTQSKTNELVERRLGALEPRSGQE